jgi:peptidyl-dipeptidase A
MLSLGASKPWPDALEVITGQRQMDGNALLQYFEPLQSWLKKQNQGQKCGW